MNTLETLQQVRALIAKDKHEDARRMLMRSDLDQARMWVMHLDAYSLNQNDPQVKELLLQMLDKEINRLSGIPDADEPVDRLPSLKKLDRQQQPVLSPRHPLRVLAVLIILLAIGVAGGAVYYFVSTNSYLMCVSPLFAATVAGYLIFHLAKFSTVRARVVALLFGMFIGLAVLGTYHALRHQEFLAFVRDDIAARDATLTPDEANALIDELLFEDTGHTGILGFLEIDVREGMSFVIDQYGKKSGPIELSRDTTVIYRILEALVLLIGPAFAALMALDEPFCTDTGKYLGFKQAGKVLMDEEGNFLRHLSMNNFKEAGQVLGLRRRGLRSLSVSFGRCTPTSDNVAMHVKQGSKDIIKSSISATQYEAFISGLKST